MSTGAKTPLPKDAFGRRSAGKIRRRAGELDEAKNWPDFGKKRDSKIKELGRCPP